MVLISRRNGCRFNSFQLRCNVLECQDTVCEPESDSGLDQVVFEQPLDVTGQVDRDLKRDIQIVTCSAIIAGTMKGIFFRGQFQLVPAEDAANCLDEL